MKLSLDRAKVATNTVVNSRIMPVRVKSPVLTLVKRHCGKLLLQTNARRPGGSAAQITEFF